MPKKVRVKFNTGIAGVRYSYSRDQVADLSYEKAAQFIKAGIATPVDEDFVLETPEKENTNLEESPGGEAEVKTESENKTEEVAEEESADEEVEEEEYPVHLGGGHYELSNGEKVRGKDEAIAAEEELKE